MFSPTSQFECAKIHSVEKRSNEKFTTTTIYGSSCFFLYAIIIKNEKGEIPMKRKLVLFLILCMCFLVGCGNGGENQSGNNSEPKKEVEKEVEITLPADFYEEGITEEKLSSIKEENGFKDAILNEDGSVTYVMTESVHKEYMKDISQSIQDSCDELANESETIVSIECNDDFTNFKVTTSSESVTLEESFSCLGFYMYSGMYHMLNGTEVDNVHIDFVNVDSGEVIHSKDSKDLTEE